jgi:hypothetical protein
MLPPLGVWIVPFCWRKKKFVSRFILHMKKEDYFICHKTHENMKFHEILYWNTQNKRKKNTISIWLRSWHERENRFILERKRKIHFVCVSSSTKWNRTKWCFVNNLTNYMYAKNYDSYRKKKYDSGCELIQ